MAQTSTPLQQLEKPTAGTAPPVDIDLINRNMDKLDKTGIVFCTSGTRPAVGLFNGLMIYETDTKRFWVYEGAAWSLVSGNAGAVFTTTGTIPNASLNQVAWGTEVSDTDNFGSAGANSFTIPAGLGGKYAVSFMMAYDAAVGTRAFLDLTLNGVAYRGTHLNEETGHVSVSGIQLDAGQTLNAKAFQQSGATRTITAARLTITRTGR